MSIRYNLWLTITFSAKVSCQSNYDYNECVVVSNVDIKLIDYIDILVMYNIFFYYTVYKFITSASIILIAFLFTFREKHVSLGAHSTQCRF